MPRLGWIDLRHQGACLARTGVRDNCVPFSCEEFHFSAVPNLYYNYEKYPLSPLKSRFLVLIEQHLPNISDPVYSVHQSFMWFLWLNWRKSTFYPVTAPNDSKCWPNVTSSIQEPAASNCDVTMTDCSRVVVMDAFLAQWNRKFITAQWSTENTSCFNFFV